MMIFFSGFRSGLRLVHKQPGLGLACVGILAAGIALAATLLSLVYGVLIRPLPFEGADRWLHVESTVSGPRETKSGLVPTRDFLYWRKHQKSFTGLAAYSQFMSFVSGDHGATEAWPSAQVTADLLEMTGRRPRLGRWVQPADETEGAPDVAVIGHALWQRHFGGRPDVVGAPIVVNGQPATVIGVAPADFAFPHSQQLWLPLRLSDREERGEGHLQVVGAARVEASAARSELEVLTRRLLKGSAASEPERHGVLVEPFVAAQADSRLRAVVSPISSAVAAVLWIACFNVAGLLLTRAVRESRHIAVRRALGATRARLVTFAFGEATALTLLAVISGLLTAKAALGIVDRFLSRGDVLRAFWMEPRLDPAVVAMVVGIAAVMTLPAGLLPAWRFASASIVTSLRDGAGGNSSGRSGRWADGLLIVEVALALVLIVLSGLTLTSAWNLSRFEPGFEVENRTTARISLMEAESPAEITAFWDRLRRRLLQDPEIETVAFGSSVPTQSRFRTEIRTEVDGPALTARQVWVDEAYFSALGARLLKGRTFDASSDRPDSPGVAVVSQSLAAGAFGAEDPIGRNLYVKSQEAPVRIVGVAADMVMGTVDDQRSRSARDLGTFFLFQNQNPRRAAEMVVKGHHRPPSPEQIRGAVAAVATTAGVFQIRPMDELLQARRWLYDAFAGLFALFGAFSLLLTLAGLHAAISTAARRRLREYGIRSALGARPAGLLLQVFKMSLRPVFVGVSIGIVAAIPVARRLDPLLFEVSAGDPIFFFGAAAVLSACGLVASVQPAVEASRVDPKNTLNAL